MGRCSNETNQNYLLNHYNPRYPLGDCFDIGMRDLCIDSRILVMNAELKIMKEKYKRLAETFEEILVEKFAISELRDFWRCRAGIKKQNLRDQYRSKT